VSIGFADDELTPNDDVAWTVIDDVVRVAQIEIHDGRQTEFDETETGSATIAIHDRTGDFDPNNVGSPYFGQLDSRPIAVALWNPVDLEWVPQWRGTIDDLQYVIEPVIGPDGKPILANVQIECVDIFDYLGTAEMAPLDGLGGGDGDTPPPDSDVGLIFYEDANVDDRINALLTDARIPTASLAMRVVFSGNVKVLESKYDTGDTFLSALREAADAEFPGLAALYVDSLGRVVFHGRQARLDPFGVAADAGGSWDFTRWKAGDGPAVQADSTRAQIREFAYARSRSRRINRATCYPEFTADVDIPGQTVDVSAGGPIYSRSDTDLINDGHQANGAPAASDTGLDDTLKIATFWTTYYSEALTRIERVTFKSVRPTDPRAAATWGLLTGASISDQLNVSVGYPGGTGIQDTNYYIEGRDMTITPLDPDFDMVELTLNVSPAIVDTEGIFDGDG